MENIFKETKFEQITTSYDNYSTDDCLFQHYTYEALMCNGNIRLRLDYLDNTLESASLEVSSFKYISSNNEPASQDQLQEALEIYFNFMTNKTNQG